MSTTPRTRPYELTIWGGTSIRHTRTHVTYAAAQAEALRVLAAIERRGGSRAAKPAIVYGPGCGPDGVTIAHV